MNRKINKVAIIGSGIMGSGIACHFANIGIEVLLLDIVPNKLSDTEIKKNLSLEDKIVKNRIVNESLAKAIKSKPSPLYHRNFKNRITTGNLTDDLEKISEADWIIEVVIENLEIKNQVFKEIEKYRKSGTIITSNTSGIPIKFMSSERSEDFQQHFAVTHFFNPPRYLKLFEIVPGPNCKNEVIEFLNMFGEKFLGKTSVLAKDTPGFIGNRIGNFGIQDLFHNMKELDISIEDLDTLTGPLIGRPKSATFRTADLVGIDTLSRVSNGIYENCPDDECRNVFVTPDFIKDMLEKNWLGDKTGQGFYKKTRDKNGKREILVLDFDSMEYRKTNKTKFDIVGKAKKIENTIDRFKVLIDGDDKVSEFYRKTLAGMFSYAQNRIPEISNDTYSIDDAVKAGFGWENGPFEVWDSIGIEEGIKLMESYGKKPAKWIEELVNSGTKSFYSIKNGFTYYYDISEKKHLVKPGQESFIILDNIRKNNLVWENEEFVIEDIGDGILNAEFRSKMNSIGENVLLGIDKAIDLAEENFQGLVIGNQAASFSAGANLAMILMAAAEQEYDQINSTIKKFQDTTMRLRCCNVPTIASVQGMTLAGGCEVAMHCDKIVANAETYTGLVEVGVGLIPAGGGTKEMTLRASNKYNKNDVELNILQEYFLTIGMAKVSTSAYEAYDLGILIKGKDIIVMNNKSQIAIAKSHAKIMAETGYVPPLRERNIKVLGKQALGMFLVGTHSMESANYISEFDKKIANKLGYVMSGGDLSESTMVSEQYLLELEREAFLSLCGERKTLERIQHMLTKGKPLRN